jgi:hypothetical protein
MTHLARLVAFVVLWSLASHAAPLNTWGVFVGKGVFAATPYLYAGPSFGAQPWLYGEYGFDDSFELAGAVAATFAPAGSFEAVELMPRYFFDENTGVALRATYSPLTSSAIIAPELHIVRTWGSFEITLNPTWAPAVGRDGPRLGSVGGIFAPEWFFSESCSAFVELTPMFSLDREAGSWEKRLSFEMLPGIGFTVAKDHQFSMGVGVPLLRFRSSEVYAGMWYSYAVGGEAADDDDSGPRGE